MKTVYLLSILFLIFSCHRKTASQNFVGQNEAAVSVQAPAIAGNTIPLCVQSRIDSIKKEPVWNPPAQVDEYEYNGRKVYLFSAPCCDFFATLVDSNCNYVCAPSGGFTGRGDLKCRDFAEKAQHLRLVWKDERARK